MSTFQRIITTLLWVSLLILVLAKAFLTENWLDSIYLWFVGILATPTLLSFLLRFIFRKRDNPKRFQWIPNTLSVLIFLFMLALDYAVTEDLSNSYSRIMEQKRIQSVVKKWIKENAAYPDTYSPVSFEKFTQLTKYKSESTEVIRDANFNPIGTFYRSQNTTDSIEIKDIEYAVYMIEHKFTLESKTHKLYTVTAYFQLTPQLEVTNVRLYSEMHDHSRKEILYQWREIFGNTKRTLELEKSGHDNDHYQYLFFYGNYHLTNVHRFKIISYSNGKKNGPLYILNDHSDTTEIANFKDDTLNGQLSYYDNRKIKKVETYIDGDQTGLQTEYYPEGTRSQEGYDLHGEKVGVWKYWDRDGKLGSTFDFGHQASLDSIVKAH